jgi:hypothetical protein
MRSAASGILRAVNAAASQPFPERSRAEFSHFGWRLHQGAEAAGVDARLVSCHELYHDRLQVTTAHGFLTHVVAALAVETEDEHWETMLAGLQSCARRVHEQFATWSSTTTLMLTRDELAAQLPGYLPYFDDVDAMVSAIPSMYLQMHFVHALHRAAMQTDVLEVAARRGLSELRLADVDRRRRPDWRLRQLRSVVRDAAAGFLESVTERWGDDPRWPALRDAPSLSEAIFTLEFEDVWDDANQRAYSLVRRLLNDAGAPTLDYDGHMEWTGAVLAQGRMVTGTRLGVALAAEAPDRADSDVAIFSMEGERLVVRDPPLAAAVVDDAPAELIAGEEPYEHVYVSLRPRDRLLPQWTLASDPALPGNHDEAVAVVRRTVAAPEGRVVQLRPLSGPDELDGCGVPVIADVSMVLVADDELMRGWGAVLDPARSAVLFDLQPSSHIRLWLANSAYRLRYAVMTAERTGRRTMVFLAQVVSGEGRSRLFVSPASGLFVRSIRGWLADVGLDERAMLDRSLIEEHDFVLQIVLGHLLGEEYVFDFLAGRRAE